MLFASGSQAILILISNLLIPIAIFVFSLGFFPYKPLIPGFSTFDKTDVSRPPQIFDRVIFMVVDALRSDFVYSNDSGFSFTQSLIRSGAALPFTAYASSPTVTMPRLKAMTSGSVPAFLDVILNIAESDTSSTLVHQDTWLAQLNLRGDRLVMYGDDTWLKLFPGMFSRFDGTTSFFVSDFTEVDNNVTRHLSDELLNDDWSAFIMHFLGLDHIGHKAGPESPYMAKKQREMDSVVSQIFRALEQEKHLDSTLFVLCGDHGMNDAGNHGGSSVGETSPALLFISPKFQMKASHYMSPTEPKKVLQYYETVEQTDLTPTLAGLLGFPIPLNSLGVFIPELLMMWDHSSHRIHILLENSKQILQVIKRSFPKFDSDPDIIPQCNVEPSNNVEGVQCAWFKALASLENDNGAVLEIEKSLLRFLKTAQELMSRAASNYDLKSLLLGTCITGLAVMLSIPSAHQTLQCHKAPVACLLLCTLLYSCMMFASSYVEEEQQFWYWIFTGWLFYLHIRSPGQFNAARQSTTTDFARLFVFVFAISHRTLRRWNQTGQKFAAEPDIARTFLPSHQHSLWTLIVLTYADTYLHLISNIPDSTLLHVMGILVTILAFLYKLVFVASDSPELLSHSLLTPLPKIFSKIPLVLHARVVMCGILFLVLYPFQKVMRCPNSILRRGVFPSTVFHETLTLFLITQSRATNIPVFLIFRLQLKALASMELSPVEMTVTSLLMQHVTFFAFGGSNSISSVDISNAYNGIGSYSVILVGILTFISNWVGPIWWMSASQVLRREQSWGGKKAHITLLSFHVTATLMAVMVSCIFLRTHLFIWTVFSPKYLYTMAWAMINHFGVNLLGETCTFLKFDQPGRFA